MHHHRRMRLTALVRRCRAAWTMRAASAVSSRSSSSSFSSSSSSTVDGDEAPWRRKAEHHAATPRAPTWSTTELTGTTTTTDTARADGKIARAELENVARLANVRLDDVEKTLEDVNGILRFVEALDGADATGVEPMWSTRDASREEANANADGLRMRFDAAARRAEAGGAPGELELAALPRARALREAKYVRAGEEFFVAPNSAVGEE